MCANITLIIITSFSAMNESLITSLFVNLIFLFLF